MVVCYTHYIALVGLARRSYYFSYKLLQSSSRRPTHLNFDTYFEAFPRFWAFGSLALFTICDQNKNKSAVNDDVNGEREVVKLENLKLR